MFIYSFLQNTCGHYFGIPICILDPFLGPNRVYVQKTFHGFIKESIANLNVVENRYI